MLGLRTVADLSGYGTRGRGGAKRAPASLSGVALALSLSVAAPLGLAAVAVAPTPALAQQTQAESMQSLMNRLQRVERELQTLQVQVYRGDTGGAAASGVAGQAMPADVAGRLQVRIGELERLVQDLTGKVEEALYQAQQVNTRLDTVAADIDYRLSALEGKPQGAGASSAYSSGAASGNRAPAPTTGGFTPQAGTLGTVTTQQPPSSGGGSAAGSRSTAAPSGTLPNAPEPEQYNYAFSMLRGGDFAGAESAFTAFLQAHPKSNLAGNAQYWLGETHYVRGDYEQAAVAFMHGYQSYPDSTKGPDNLLKLGLSMANLGKTKEACAAFGRLGGQYPRAADAIKRRATTEMSRLGC